MHTGTVCSPEAAQSSCLGTKEETSAFWVLCRNLFLLPRWDQKKIPKHSLLQTALRRIFCNGAQQKYDQQRKPPLPAEKTALISSSKLAPMFLKSHSCRERNTFDDDQAHRKMPLLSQSGIPSYSETPWTWAVILVTYLIVRLMISWRCQTSPQKMSVIIYPIDASPETLEVIKKTESLQPTFL